MPPSFWAVLTISVVGWAGRFIFPFLALYLSVQVGFSLSATGVIISLYGMGGLLSVLASGFLIDKFGAKRLLLLSIIGTGLSAAGLVFASEQVYISILVLFVGLFSTVMSPSVNTIITTQISAEKLRSAFSLQFVAINMGFAIAPLVSGFLVQVSYTLLFVAEAFVMTLSLLIVVMFIPKDDFSKIEYSITSTNPIPIVKTQVSFLKDKTFLFFISLNILFMVIYMQTQISLPLVMEQQGFSPLDYGIILTLNGLLVMSLQIPFDSMTRKFPISKLLALGMLLLSIGFTVHAFSSSMLLYIIAVIIWSSAEIFSMPLAVVVTSNLAPRNALGRYQGVNSTTHPLASIFGPIMGGLLLQTFGAQIFWLLCAGALIGGMILRLMNSSEIEQRIAQKP